MKPKKVPMRKAIKPRTTFFFKNKQNLRTRRGVDKQNNKNNKTRKDVNKQRTKSEKTKRNNTKTKTTN